MDVDNMNTLLDKIKSDQIEAMKSKNKEKLSTLRLLVAELEKEKIALKSSGLSDSQVENVISRQIKKLDKEIEAYVAVGRGTDSQNSEKELLLSYLPKQASEDEIRELVFQAIALTDKGEVKNPMQYLSSKLKGKADMSLVSKIVKELSK